MQGWIRVAKCCMILGNISAAENALTRVADLEPNNSSLAADLKTLDVVKRFDDEAIKAYDKKDYRKVIECVCISVR